MYIIFFPQNSTVYEIMSKNIGEPDRSQMTINAAHAICMLYN